MSRLFYAELHVHPCPNCGADERELTVRERWSRRGDLRCRECGYEVGACGAPCPIPEPAAGEVGRV